LICKACGYRCNECIHGPLECTECSGTLRYIEGTPDCGCPYGYYDDGQNEACQVCSYKCPVCELEGCIECIENRVDEAAGCPCDYAAGYYEDGNALCPPCAYRCATCPNGNECTTCSDVNRDVDDDCKCKEGWFDDGTAICKECDYKCLACSDADSCDTCDTANEHRVNAAEFCPCDTGYYEDPATL
jgi:hypothetical protein